MAFEGVAGLHAEVGYAERRGEDGDVLRLDLVEAYLHLEIGVQAPAEGGGVVEGEDGDAVAEQLLQAFRCVAGLRCGLPAVLAVHVEYEVGGDVALEDAREQYAGEEALAGTALAEDAVGAFDELLEVQADAGVLHVEGAADPDVAGIRLIAEDGGYVLAGSAVGAREMGRERPRGLGGVLASRRW